ncbi:MAG: hypothetical protein AABX01_01995 [Candidatus Micrarchaeota archaeon]
MAKRIGFAIALIYLIGAASAAFIGFWNGTEASIPQGWTCISCDQFPIEDEDSSDFYQRFPVCNATGYGFKGGNNNNSHTVGYLSGQVSNPSSTTTALVGMPNGFNSASATHKHSSWATNSFPQNTSLPPYKNIRVIRTNTELPTFIPQGVIILFNSTEIPSNFSRFSEFDEKFIRGDDSISSEGGSASHSHYNVNITLQGSTGASVAQGTFKWSVATSSHVHPNVFVNVTETEHIPLFYDVVMIQATANASIPAGTIGLFNTTVSNPNWSQVTTCNNMYLRANNSYGTTGGEANHTHPNVSGQTTGGNSGVNRDTGSTSFAFTSHTHSFNASISTVANQPPYITVLMYKFEETPYNVTDENEGRQAITEGINNTIPNSTISTDQQIYLVYPNGEQKLSSFDKVAVLGNQTWGFNYLTENETATNMTSIGKSLNIWESLNLAYSQIVAQVLSFISLTRN